MKKPLKFFGRMADKAIKIAGDGTMAHGAKTKGGKWWGKVRKTENKALRRKAKVAVATGKEN